MLGAWSHCWRLCHIAGCLNTLLGPTSHCWGALPHCWGLRCIAGAVPHRGRPHHIAGGLCHIAGGLITLLGGCLRRWGPCHIARRPCYIAGGRATLLGGHVTLLASTGRSKAAASSLAPMQHFISEACLVTARMTGSVALQDAAGQLGGSLIFSTSAAGSNSSSPSLVDRLTIDSSGLAEFSAGLIMTSNISYAIINGNVILGTTASNTLIVNAAAQFNAAVAAANDLSVAGAFVVSGSSTLGTTSSNQLTINAASQFNAAVAAANNMNVAGTLTASGSSTLGTSSSNFLTVNAAASFASTAMFAAAVTANSAVNVASLLTASGNTVLGASSSNTLMVNAAATFYAGLQLLGTSNTAAIAPAISYLRRYPSAAAAATNAVVGSAVYSRWDGSAYNPTAQIRSVYTVRPFQLLTTLP